MSEPDDALDGWWADLTAAALVGTGRRPPPPAPDWPVGVRDDASRETTLLDAVALGGALRRAGGRAAVAATDAPGAAPAPPDALPLAPARARQLLDLLLGQSPVGPALRPLLLRLWLEVAATHGVRVHHATLVPLLTLASGNRGLRVVVRPVLDHRGVWLAALNPREWAWVARTPGSGAPDAVDAAEWARLPTEQRAVQARVLRRHDPAAARALIATTWGTDPAPARATLLGVLEVGLGPDDEPFLERALDDRATGVREAAALLLDGLPGSARAARMAARLTPLLSTSGLLRRTLHVELPLAPDAAGVRDGLGRAARGQSERGLWLQRIVAGAPLDTWTESGFAPHAVVTALVRERVTDALTGLRRAALLRSDLDWARALLDHGWDGLLVASLPDAERAERLRRRVGEVASYADLLAAVRLLPGPWPPEVSAAVVARIGAIAAGDGRAYELPGLVPVLAAGLHPGAAGAVQRLADRGDPGSEHLHHLAQFLALVPTITEAFA